MLWSRDVSNDPEWREESRLEVFRMLVRTMIFDLTRFETIETPVFAIYRAPMEF